LHRQQIAFAGNNDAILVPSKKNKNLFSKTLGWLYAASNHTTFLLVAFI
jgi:hypothetical protein